MTLKNRRKFAETVQELAEKKGIRIGFLIISDRDGTSGYSSLNSIEDAPKDLEVLRRMLIDLSEGGRNETA